MIVTDCAEILSKLSGIRAVFSLRTHYTRSLGAMLINSSVIYDAEAVYRQMGSAGIDADFEQAGTWKPTLLTRYEVTIT